MTEVMEAAGAKLRAKLYTLARQEREVRREIGNRVLSSQSVEDLRVQRRELRESQEDLSCAILQLEAAP